MKQALLFSRQNMQPQCQELQILVYILCIMRASIVH